MTYMHQDVQAAQEMIIKMFSGERLEQAANVTSRVGAFVFQFGDKLAVVSVSLAEHEPNLARDYAGYLNRALGRSNHGTTVTLTGDTLYVQIYELKRQFTVVQVQIEEVNREQD